MIVNTETMVAVSEISFSGKDQVGDIFWVNDKKIIISILSRKIFVASPVFYGELYSFDIAENKGVMVFGPRMSIIGRRRGLEKRIRKMHRKIPNGWASVINVLPDESDYILIRVQPYSNELITRVYKLNITNGSFDLVAYAPLQDSQFFSSSNGKLLLAIGTNNSYQKIVFELDKTKKTWSQLQKFDYTGIFEPLTYDRNSNSLFVIDNVKNKTSSIYQLNLTTAEKKVIFNDPDNDILNVELSDDKRFIYGVVTEEYYPNYHFPNINPEHENFLRMLSEGFKNYRVSITSTTKDLKKFVFFVSSDQSPGSWYLFDVEKNDAKFLVNKNSLIKANEMLPKQGFSFTSRDGLKIHAYITLPKSNSQNDLFATVVLVHGGPFGVREQWVYESKVQMLAASGYAVVQVNFRGSGGFGRKFIFDGYGHWGDDIQFDIDDGIQYLIDQKFIDPKRICIMGGSFGGYSAVQLSILKPQRFKCAIASSGVYDLELLYKEGDTIETHWGKSFWKQTIGEDKERLKLFSPINHINRLETPLLVVHGVKDKRAPISHAEALKEQLEEHDKIFEWLIFDYEGHSIYNDDNRLEYYQKVVKFLKKYNPPN